MAVIIQRRDPDTDTLNNIGRIEDGEITDGSNMLAGLFGEEIPDEDALLDRFDGPTLFAGQVTDAEDTELESH